MYTAMIPSTKMRSPGVYLEFKDRRRRKKSECLTIEGLTPKQAKSLFLRFVREQTRKAG